MSKQTERRDGYDTFRSIPALKAAAENAGNHWFSKGAMRFFNSRVETGILSGRYFVSSEQFDQDSPRLYSARMVTRDPQARPTLDIETLGDFQGHKTVALAKAAIAEHIAKGEQ